ncbi:DUF948 domain-containing protein [Planococcus sp. N028]|uniref:DUF948 domain-containing protein n=1 Tax=Planococcus shixiaomingii TaxID=3058393 RepID=A0ABT8N5F6_9BACL|nr:DUF948 domain-containing protein [Planococcus sp. N028]MDN7243117.1 DUF948 domain-containing protein [Planococcus sp. N028]
MSPSIWLYIALAIFIVALIIVGIGVGIFIKGIKEPLKEMKGSANNLKERTDKLNLEATSLQHHVNELKEDMQAKSEKVSMLLDAARGTKNSVLDLNSSVRRITVNIASEVDNDKGNIAQINQWSIATADLLELQGFLKTRKDTYSTHSSIPQIENKQQ